MKQPIVEMMQITHFGKPSTSRRLATVVPDAHEVETFLTDQLLLARHLLQVESIQRAEAWESGEIIHTLKRPLSNIRSIADFKRYA